MKSRNSSFGIQHASRRRRFNAKIRRGYSLVFVAMFLFGFMALAALVIDIGFVRLTQRQLQLAADSGAIEGLRGSGFYTEGQQRAAANDFVTWTFDDDLNVANLDDGAFDSGSGEFGAGPQVNFSGGAGDPALYASQLMTVDPANPVHKPVLIEGFDTGNEFSVELRRGANDLPNVDLYSDGPPLPFLFARGSLISRQSVNAGVVVRGFGHASPRPALSIGLSHSLASPVMLGLAPVMFELSYWNSLMTEVADVQAVTGGEISMVGRCFDLGGNDLPVVIGRQPPAASVLADGVYDGYVPIYSDISDGMSSSPRVVGFGRAELQLVTTMTQSITVTRKAQFVAAENASAVACYSLDLNPTELANVLAANTTVAEVLQAPASER